MTQLDPALEVARAFKATLAAMRRMRSRELRRPDELGDAQYGLLFSLRERSPLSTGDLADAAEVSKPAATEMLEALEHAGLVRRERSVLDRRVVLCELTEHGRELVDRRRAEWEARLRAVLGDYPERDLRVTATVLGRLAQLFDERAAERDAEPDGAVSSATAA